MEITDYLRALRNYWVSVLVAVIGGIAVAGIASLVMTPVYTAPASVIFTVPNAAAPNDLSVGAAYAANQAKSYVLLARSPLVLDAVVSRLGLSETAPQLSSRITASIPVGTAIVNLQVTGTNPEQVAAISNSVAQQLIVVVNELSPQYASGNKAVKATMVSPASVPTTQSSPKVLQNLVIGALGGLVLAVGQAALRARLAGGTRVAHESESGPSEPEGEGPDNSADTDSDGDVGVGASAGREQDLQQG